MPVVIPHSYKQVEVISPTKISATKGTVYWSEDFENNVLKFTTGSIVDTVSRVRTGKYALQLTSKGTANWDTNATCKVIAVRPEIINSKVALELYFMPESVNNTSGGLSSFQFRLTISNGTTQHKVGVQIVFPASGNSCTVKYWNSSGNWTDTGTTVSLNADYYYRLKLTWDMVNRKYDKIEIGTTTIDLSNISYQIGANGTNEVWFYVTVVGVDATTQSVWIDDITFTYNEP